MSEEVRPNHVFRGVYSDPGLLISFLNGAKKSDRTCLSRRLPDPELLLCLAQLRLFLFNTPPSPRVPVQTPNRLYGSLRSQNHTLIFKHGDCDGWKPAEKGLFLMHAMALLTEKNTGVIKTWFSFKTATDELKSLIFDGRGTGQLEVSFYVLALYQCFKTDTLRNPLVRLISNCFVQLLTEFFIYFSGGIGPCKL